MIRLAFGHFDMASLVKERNLAEPVAEPPAKYLQLQSAYIPVLIGSGQDENHERNDMMSLMGVADGLPGIVSDVWYTLDQHLILTKSTPHSGEHWRTSDRSDITGLVGTASKDNDEGFASVSGETIFRGARANC
jgi:hypothetical protein